MNAEFLTVEQGSDEWFKMRLGAITASKAYDLLPSKRGGGFKEARAKYMNQLIAEVCTGFYEEINAKPLEWGKKNEVAARAAYKFETGLDVTEGGIIYSLNRRVACSPDFRVIGMNRGGEIKCPWNSLNHVSFLFDNEEIKDEWITQMQFQMWVSGFEVWDFASFDPRMKSKMISIKTIERDLKTMSLFDELVPSFIKEMDEKLSMLEISFGSQWAA